MAYLARIELDQAQPVAAPPTLAQVEDSADFSPLEWSVIRLAGKDRLWTIRPPGLLRRAFNWMVGIGNPELASDRLEALRKIAVLSWHFGFTIDPYDLRGFLAAGFTTDQYALLVSSVRPGGRARLELVSTQVPA